MVLVEVYWSVVFMINAMLCLLFMANLFLEYGIEDVYSSSGYDEWLEEKASFELLTRWGYPYQQQAVF